MISTKDKIGPERWAMTLKKISASRKEQYRKEKMRMHWGLPQRTRIKVTRQTQGAYNARQRLKALGYIVQYGDAVVRYTAETNRCRRLEETARKHGLVVETA